MLAPRGSGTTLLIDGLKFVIIDDLSEPVFRLNHDGHIHFAEFGVEWTLHSDGWEAFAPNDNDPIS